MGRLGSTPLAILWFRVVMMTSSTSSSLAQQQQQQQQVIPNIQRTSKSVPQESRPLLEEASSSPETTATSESHLRSLQTSTSRATCEASKERIETANIASNGQKRVVCTCGDNTSLNGSTLNCNDACRFCKFNDNDAVVCGREGFGETYNGSGDVVQKVETFAYSQGRDEVVFFRYTGCSNNGGGTTTCTDCDAFVDGVRCNSCSVTACGGDESSSQAPLVDCENVEVGATFNFCPDSGLVVPAGSVFEYKTPSLDIYDRCILQVGPVEPLTLSPRPTVTLEPTASPAPTFINNTQCPLQVGTDNCLALLPNIPSDASVDPSCTCFNFCGSEYSGCCGLNEACGIECPGGQAITAGCRLDGVVGTPVEDGCSADFGNGTVLEFAENESFERLGDIDLSGCGSPDEFPCFCASLTESDNVRCPYCPVTTFEDVTFCIRNGENATFVSTQGYEQNCRCSYIGNNLASLECTLVDPIVPDQCGLELRTEQCADLTAPMSPIEDCDCYNFCAGSYTGCCKFGEFCSASCSGPGTSTDDIVAGCLIDPEKPPTTPMPVDPTQSPTPEPAVCLVTSNTDNCPLLMLSQNPIEGCECYNFCGDRLAPCCQKNDPSCTVSCTLFPGEELTAGCTFPENEGCKAVFDACTESLECCSGRCLLGQCRNRRAPKQIKQKLSTGLGGAGNVSKGGNLRKRYRKLIKSRIKGA